MTELDALARIRSLWQDVFSDINFIGSALDIAVQAKSEGVNSLRVSGLNKVRLGITSLEEVLGCTNE